MPFQIAIDIGENEQDPNYFKECVVLGEKLGFDVIWLGDHFLPWAHSSNRSSFVWSLMGSSLEASKKVKLGPYVTTPIGARYHPAIIAQAAATLDNMYPGRFLLTVGTGEAMNEAPFFQRWPNWKERMERLIEGTQLIRKLWKSESPLATPTTCRGAGKSFSLFSTRARGARAKIRPRWKRPSR
jgi:coenzyme F420-dependent glucose-6-phosphate dehydrogenase